MGTIVSTRRMKFATPAHSIKTCCRAACTTRRRVLGSPIPLQKERRVALTFGEAEDHKVTPSACPGLGWFQETVELQETQKREREVTCKERSDSGSESNTKIYRCTKLSQDLWTRHKARRCGTWSSNSAPSARASKRNLRMPELRVPTSPEERKADAKAPRRYSTVTPMTDASPVSKSFGSPCTYPNSKPSFNYLHLSSVSQRCERSDIELEDVFSSRPGEGSWSWILFNVTAQEAFALNLATL